jgi:putative Ca2+/H+ antiporter (TMEM165/GDT1 family)
MGDKTQLLALVLALRFRKPLVVMLGIFVATVLNHGAATWVGGWLGQQVAPEHLRLGLAVIFFAFAVWILIPDKIDEASEGARGSSTSAFLTTTVLFFLAEMGDKTQLATVALGARFQAPVLVTLGTTLGMLVADGVAVVFGERFTSLVPMRIIRFASAALFVAFGAAVYLT